MVLVAERGVAVVAGNGFNGGSEAAEVVSGLAAAGVGFSSGGASEKTNGGVLPLLFRMEMLFGGGASCCCRAEAELVVGGLVIKSSSIV